MATAQIAKLHYTSLDSIDLEESPDSVEKCPSKHASLFICCTYELLQQENESTPAHLMNRKGSIILFSLESERLTKQACLRTEAILDSKWKKTFNDENYIFATADAKGCVQFYSLLHKPKSSNVYKLDKIANSCSAKNGLALSLDWCSDGSLVSSSDSNGFISIINLTPNGPVQSGYWNAHNAEAWITSFNHWDDNIIYSGADDCKFCGWDVRSKTRMFTNSSHQAGVCSIQCNLLSPHIIATGSYDEYVRIWDLRNIRRLPLSEIHVGGGVWRIKWHASTQNIMLTACMFGGFNVIDFRNAASPIVSHSFNTAEGSLAYGADWVSSRNRDDIVASCTFYDRKLSIGILESDDSRRLLS